jgi:hypothetical protein
MDPKDVYARGAYADLLLQQERFEQARSLLVPQIDNPVLLLRYALAERALGRAGPEVDERIARLQRSFEPDVGNGEHVHRRAPAAEPVLAWLEETGLQSPRIARLVETVRQQHEPPIAVAPNFQRLE